jgi:Mn-dependent DtxR family transcriptional regulator
MTQHDIYKFLKRNNRVWYTNRDLSKKLGLTLSSITNGTRKLAKHSIIQMSKKKRGVYNVSIFKYGGRKK